METNTFPLELLTNDNYADWSVKMKNKLMAQGLWDIVETGLGRLKPDDDEVEYEARRKMNDAALYAIESSCSMDILSRINNISSSKTAWKMLGKIPMESNGQDKQIEIDDDDDDSKIDEGNPSSSNNPGPEIREDDYKFGQPLLKAVRMGDWNATRDFLERHPNALTARMAIFHGRGTVLHAAVYTEQEHIVEKLVNMISEHDLAMKDDFGYTALHISGNHRVAECLIRKNKRLVSIRNKGNLLPVALAMSDGHKELARYLYLLTPLEDLEADEGLNGASLLNGCFYHRDLDMALDLMERFPRLALALDGRGVSPLEVLAEISTDAFELSGNYEMVFWKQWIYNHCIHISSADSDGAGGHLNIQNGQKNTIGSVRAVLWRQLVSTLLNLLGFKRLYEMKLVRVRFQHLLFRMCQAVPTLNASNGYDIIEPAIFGAVRRGNFEFVYHIVKANPDIFWRCDAVEKRTIFHWAILHRQHRIFRLLYSLKKNSILNKEDNSGNTILHMAGMVIENTAIDSIRGAALQMQREVQWFKEVECICSHKEFLNNDGFTARQLFMEDHKEMRKEGEKWMKRMATSCIVVGALIITITVLAALTIPGELMFLGILKSRYAEEDFLRSLPTKMIIGLFALFFSITIMVIAFSAALLLMIRGKYKIIILIIGLTGSPVILFVLMKFRLLVDMFNSTYRPGIFDRKMKPWF